MHVSGSGFRSISAALDRKASRSPWAGRTGESIDLKLFFDKQCPTTKTIWSPTDYSWTLVKLLRLFKLEERSVLDVGCGSGVLALSVAQRGAKTFASDILPEAVAATKRNAVLLKLGLTVKVSDCLDYWIESNRKFDVIVCNPPCFDLLSTAKPSSNAEENTFLTVDLLKNYGAVLKRPGCLFFAVSGRENMEWARDYIKNIHGIEPSVNQQDVPVNNVERSKFDNLARLGLIARIGDKWLWHAYYFAALHL